MTYIPGSGGGNGSIGTSSDVALNNPMTDANAARPTLSSVENERRADECSSRFGLWLNGVEAVSPSEPVANLYSSGDPSGGPQTTYLKQGIYRGRTSRVHTIHHTGTVRGSSKDSVLRYLP